MPVEIRELVIRAVVSEDEEPAREAPPGGESGRENLIADCLDEIARVLREREER